MRILINKKPKLVVISVLSVAMLFGFASTAGAVSAVNNDVSSLINQVQNLLEQVKNLQVQLAEMQKQQGQIMTQLRETLRLTKSLSLGMSNEEVEELQKVLASDPTIYPEGLVTGYFGPLTEKAVKKFQQKYGIEQIGIVGPQTRSALHAFWNTGSTTTSISMPPGLAKQAQNNWGVGSTTELTTTGHKVLICHNGHTISVALPALSAHLAHGDSPVPCGPVVDDGDDGDDTDTTAPTIDTIEITNIATTTATVSWSTNEEATGILWYSTSTPVDIEAQNTEKLENSSLMPSHSFGLSGLATSTAYYLIITAKDAAGNIGTSTEETFITTN
ncbi:MAG: peptidoglycan-binding protein [Candidatus Zambryskibacteria bacterium]|nr:peptidoglycan-binding protein [Candidatus Zambryskibacteria bacterium]